MPEQESNRVVDHLPFPSRSGLVQRVEHEPGMPRTVGVITYPNGLLAVGESGGRLEVARVANPPESLLREASNTKRRLDFPGYAAVHVSQVDVTNPAAVDEASSQRHALLAFEFHVLDSETQNEKVPVTIVDTAITNIFARVGGGIARFSDGKSAEDLALVVTDEVDGKSVAEFFFMHPEDTAFKPIIGLQTFLRNTNDVLANHLSGEEGKQALTVLQRYMDKGTLTFSNDLRREIFRAIVIAHATRAERGSWEDGEILGELVPQSRVPGVRRPLSSPQSFKKRYQALAEDVVDSVFLKAGASEDVREVQTIEPEIQFKTPLVTGYIEGFNACRSTNARLCFINGIEEKLDGGLLTREELGELRGAIPSMFRQTEDDTWGNPMYQDVRRSDVPMYKQVDFLNKIHTLENNLRS